MGEEDQKQGNRQKGIRSVSYVTPEGDELGTSEEIRARLETAAREYADEYCRTHGISLEQYRTRSAAYQTWRSSNASDVNALCEYLSFPYSEEETSGDLGETDLMFAAECGARESVELLLDHGADPAAYDDLDDYADAYAEARGYRELAEYLKRRREQAQRLE